MRARFLLVVVLAALAVGDAATARPPQTSNRPNVVVIETDDQTLAEMSVLPKTRELIGRQGVTFDNSFVSFSLCCPSRASLLTGQYSHNNGVRDNKLPYGGYYKLDGSNTLAVWLQRAGYYTALVGKYLNAYGSRDPHEIPPGWTDWHGSIDPTTYRYYGYKLNDNGVVRTYCAKPQPSCYQTDVYAQKAVSVIDQHAGSPLFLWVAFLAPHAGAPREADDPPGVQTPVPAPRYKDAFAFTPLPRPPNFDERDMRDKPRTMRKRRLLTPEDIAGIQENWQQRRETLLAVDDAVASIVNALRAKGQLDNTLIMFMSDNGFFHGEHRVRHGKVLPYEESIRVPLLMRWTGNASLPRNVHRPQLAMNVDYAETILAAAGARPGLVEDGLNLLRFWRDAGLEPGRDLLIDNQPTSIHFDGIRTRHFFYAEYRNGDRELYDLRRDPYELQSQHADPRYAALRAALSKRLHRLVTCAGTTCHVHPRARIAIRCSARSMRLAVNGRDVKSVLFYANGHRIGRDSRAPFRVRTRVRPGPIRARVTYLFDQLATFDRPGCE